MALRNQPYLPLYVNDFLTDEKLCECSAESTGVYIRTMCLMHKSEEYGVILLKQNDKQNSSSISNFARKLAKHMPYDFEVIERSINELVEFNVLQIDGDRMLQKRMIKDNYISEVRSEAGKAGCKTRFCLGKSSSKTQANTQAKVQAKPVIENVIEIESESKSEGENQVITNFKKAVKKKKSDNGLFDKFYEKYPRKISKESARKAFAKLDATNELLEWMFYSIDQSKATTEWMKEGGQYIPYPATWLNNHRWEDFPMPVKREPHKPQPDPIPNDGQERKYFSEWMSEQGMSAAQMLEETKRKMRG